MENEFDNGENKIVDARQKRNWNLWKIIAIFILIWIVFTLKYCTHSAEENGKEVIIKEPPHKHMRALPEHNDHDNDTYEDVPRYNPPQSITTSPEVINITPSKIYLRYSITLRDWVNDSIPTYGEITLSGCERSSKYYLELCQIRNRKLFCDTIELRDMHRYALEIDRNTKKYILRNLR